MSNNLQKSAPSFLQNYRFWIVLVCVVFLKNIPFVSVPFKWLESYFHEISHGIAAIATGGEIVSIQLFANGAGLCTSMGGMAFIIAFFGYAGASLWGAMLYTLASANLKAAKVITVFVTLLLVLTCILWTRDILTLVILIILIALFLLKLKLVNNDFIQFALQLSGMSVLLNALASPLYLLDGRALGDGAALSSLTFIPEIVWVVIWCAIGLTLLVLIAKRERRV